MHATWRGFSAFCRTLANWNDPPQGHSTVACYRADPWTAEQGIFLVDLDSPPPQQVIYNPVCCKTSRARAGIRVWPATEAMDHHKSALIECKLGKKQHYVSVYIMRIKLECSHTNILYVHKVCVCLFQVFIWWARIRYLWWYTVHDTFAL